MTPTKSTANESEEKSATENDSEIEKRITLPNVIPDQPGKASKNSSVMWAGPDALADGARSEGHQIRAQAGGVTLGVQTHDGADLAGALQADTSPKMLRGRYTGIEMEPQSIQTHAHQDSFVSHADQLNRIVNDMSAKMNALHASFDVGISADEAMDVVRKGRLQIKQMEERRGARKDTERSSSTQKDYDKKCRQMDQEVSDLETTAEAGLKIVLGQHAAKKQTFNVLKAALKARALSEVERLLKHQDAIQRHFPKTPRWKFAVLDLRASLKRLSTIESLDRVECMNLAGTESVAAHSKRKDLRNLPSEWRENFLRFNEKSETYKSAGVLLVNCGLRPEELEMGVTLKIVSEGVHVHIKGAKVRATAGQPERSFTLKNETLPSWFVSEVSNRETLVVKVKSKDALRAHLGRMTLDVFQFSEARRKKLKITLSAYHFRHALVTDLREAQWDTELIAAAIGESAAATVSYYGMRSRSGSRKPRATGVIQSSVKATREVRKMDTTGLKQFTGSKASNGKKSLSANKRH
jgi:hypothetical protein